MLTRVDDKNYLASVKALPDDGKANDDLCRLLGKYFHVPPTSIRIVHGTTSRQKIVEVPMSREALDPLSDEL